LRSIARSLDTSYEAARRVLLAARQEMLGEQQGLRNMTRRPSQMLVLPCGLALSTAVMTALFGLSDSIAASEVQQRLARMGAVDESITGPFTQAQVDTALTQLRQDSHDGVNSFPRILPTFYTCFLYALIAKM